MEYLTYKKMVVINNALFIGVGILLVVLSIFVLSENIYTGIMFLCIGLAQIGFSSTLFFRLKGKEMEKFGEAVMQHTWWIFSDSVAALLIFIAPFFNAGLLTYVAEACSLVWFILGFVTIMLTNRICKIPFSA